MPDSKRALVEARLGKRLRDHALSSYRDYVQLIQGEGGAAELLELINSITTNKTSFFRENHHFDFLRDRLFPAARERGREVRIWSAGCSLGAEPYSTAMTASDANAPVRILATDIDTNVLGTAKAGNYDVEQLSVLAPDVVRRHFMRGDGEKRGLYRVRPEIRDLVDFQRLNLIDKQWSVRDTFDVIFCRNVVIYFDRPTQRGLFERFAERLSPGGVMILGHSENLAWMPEMWEVCGRTMYQRRGDAGPALCARWRTSRWMPWSGARSAPHAAPPRWRGKVGAKGGDASDARRQRPFDRPERGDVPGLRDTEGSDRRGCEGGDPAD